MEKKTMAERIEEVISILRKEKDVEEIEYDSTGYNTHIRVKRFVGFDSVSESAKQETAKK